MQTNPSSQKKPKVPPLRKIELTDESDNTSEETRLLLMSALKN